MPYTHLTENEKPEIIAERLKIDYTDDDEMRVSHETIYRWIYIDANGGGTLYRHLRRKLIRIRGQALIRPRQTGKTTIARHVMDIENN